MDTAPARDDVRVEGRCAKLGALLFGRAAGKRSGLLWTVVAFLAIPLLGVLDSVTGHHLFFSILYLAPIWAVVWLSGRRAGVLAAVASAGVWLAADLLGTALDVHPAIPYWNAAARLGIFLVVVILLAQVRSVNERLEATLQERTVGLRQETEDHRRTGESLDLSRRLVDRCQAELSAAEQCARTLVEHSLLGVFTFDRDLIVTECNARLTEMLHSPREQLLGFDLHRLRDARFLPALQAALGGRAAGYEGPYHTTVSERQMSVALRTAPLLAADGSSLGGTGMLADLTAGKQAEELLERLACRDPLTELPNRVLLHDRLRQALASAGRGRQRLAVCVLDLDRFRIVNEAFGRDGGDRLLQALAARLSETVRESDTVARTGGDEFTLLLPCDVRAGDPLALAERLQGCLAEPFEIEGHSVRVKASLGIALFPEDGREPEVLLRNAGYAMRRAQELGGDGCQFYDPAMSRRATLRLSLEGELRTAIEREQFVMHYQPQVDLRDGAIIGVEALVRWQHPERGLLPPAEFLPLAEETGLIRPLDGWVLATTCREVVDWRNGDGAPLRLAVNVAPSRLQDPGFVESFATALQESGLPPERLEAELTETGILADSETAARVLAELRELGVTTALDDFGTGYSSLSHLHRLPIDAVKIDRSFVGRCECDPDAAAIVAAVTDLGHNLGLRVVAEGVETEEELRLVQRLGCDEAQGYLFARPLPADELRALLAAQECFPLPTLALL